MTANPLPTLHKSLGAQLAPDGIPLQYTDLLSEYQAIDDGAILLDRSHQGRLILTGSSRADLLQRISTNDLLNMTHGEARPTIFTNPNGRIIERVMVVNRGDDLLLITDPGRADALRNYLQRNIFFQDDVQVQFSDTAQFTIHGTQADAVAQALYAEAGQLSDLHSAQIDLNGVSVLLGRDKPFVGSHWLIVCPLTQADSVWKTVLELGKSHGLMAAGSLTFNALRIRAGRPAMGRELSTDFIPLEVGVWDEVSFSKGCYTGQEIIARMESRRRLAKTIVRLELSAMVNAPAEISAEGKKAGTLTSSVTAPDGTIFAMGVVKTALAHPDQNLDINGVQVRVIERIGVQPDVEQED